MEINKVLEHIDKLHQEKMQAVKEGVEITKILQYIDKLSNDKINAIRKSDEAASQIEFFKNESEACDHYAADMAKAQAKFKMALKESAAQGGRLYANLNTIVEAARPSLSEHGFNTEWKYIVNPATEKTYFECRIKHKSGQWTRSLLPFNPEEIKHLQFPQTLGSLTTYLKRYMFAALVGCVDGIDDDDGQKAVQSYRANH